MSAGFSLVEIMVGMLIGLLGMIIILQVFKNFEGQKRTTTGGSDAQNSAAIAMHRLQSDLRMSGYAISAADLFNCNIVISGVNIPLAPVIINPSTAIIPSGDSNTDRLLVFYGSTDSEPQGNSVTAQSGLAYTVQAPSSFKANDRVIAAPKSCSGIDLFVDRIDGNPDATAVNAASGAASVATLYNLGQTPQMLAYAIRNGNLTVCDYFAKNCGDSTPATLADPAVWVPIAYDIVSMKAQYGRDTAAGSMDGIVDVYDQTMPADSCGWTRTSAVRLALVARNSQLEKTDVTTDTPTWAGSSDDPINLAGDVKWQRYRYKVFQTVVPIRNVVWMGVLEGC